MLISIEGNIGSGKSTFCKYLKDHFSRYYNKPSYTNIHFVDEPVDEWLALKDSEGNILEHFYKCPEKYSYCFQMTAYISRLVNLKNQLKKSKPNDIIIMERSVFSDYNVFAKMLHASGKINDIEYQSYKMWFDHFLEEIPGILFVYLRTDFDKCYERVTKRSRVEENKITLDYLKECELYHNKWLLNQADVLEFNGNVDVSVHVKYLDILKQLINYKTNYPKNYYSNDSDCEHYYESHSEKNKWNSRLYNQTLEHCKKRCQEE